MNRETMTMPDLADLRARFPALASTDADGRPLAFFDGPAGTHVPDTVIEAISDFYRHANANLGGHFETSQRAAEVVGAARQAVADLVGGEADEVVFGPNMTTLTYAMSRALGRTWSTGDEVVVTRLDHDANVAPWQALAERGVVVRPVDFHTEDCTLDLDALVAAINRKTQLVAVGHASNAVGTINPVARIAEMAHAVGAQVWVDAVHSAPHVSIDVETLGADYLVCSAYKFFGPHVGALWMRRELAERIEPYKVRPAPSSAPGKFESGTQSYEGMAGATAAIDYLASIGRRADAVAVDESAGSQDSPRRGELLRAFATIRAWEMPMAARLIDGLREVPGATVYGISDASRLDERCPTVSFRLDGHAPSDIAARLAADGICVWSGNNYAIAVTERLGIEDDGGLVRVGIVHYNTPDEVERLLEAVSAIAASG
jgi:cysteine desulfurase family protein (TIGR01976 family)